MVRPDQFAQAVSDGKLDPTNLIGNPLVSYLGVDLPIQHAPESTALFSNSATLHDDVLDYVKSQVLTNGQAVTLGSGTVSLSDGIHLASTVTLATGTSVNGTGTLVVTESFTLQNDAVLNWDGDVIIYGGAGADALLENDGTINITGNLLVIAEPEHNVSLLVKASGHLEVHGALSCLTTLNPNTTVITMKNEGNLVVEGILTLLGPKVDFNLIPTSDSFVNGLLQVGAPGVPEDDTSLLMTIGGPFEVRQHDLGVKNGADALARIGASFPADRRYVENEDPGATVYLWRRVPSQ